MAPSPNPSNPNGATVEDSLKTECEELVREKMSQVLAFTKTKLHAKVSKSKYRTLDLKVDIFDGYPVVSASVRLDSKYLPSSLIKKLQKQADKTIKKLSRMKQQ